jgi:hypothetical protein
MTTSQITSLIENSTLRRLERMRINSSRLFTNKSRGEHLAGRSGQSTEFSDYRDYSAGDDTRFVDWNVFARLNRPYLKLYRQEEEMHVVILIDNSLSMNYEGKFERAQQLAASFGIVGLLAGEKVSVYPTHQPSGAPTCLAPCRGRSSLRKLFAFIESIEPEGATPLETSIESILKFHRGRGLVVVLSDFMTFGDLGRCFNRLFSSGLEINAVQLLSPTELYPEVTGDMRFVDCECDEVLDVSSVGELLELYHQYRIGFEERLRELCTHRSGRFISANAAASIDTILFDDLVRKGWLQ